MGSSVSYELVIDATASEIDIALLRDKALLELSREKSDIQFSVGDIYLGRIKKIMPGLNAAFVDIGFKKDAFLHYLDLGPQFSTMKEYLSLAVNRKGRMPSVHRFKRLPDIKKDGKMSDVLKQGDPVVVQIVKEPISTKGPRLTSEVSLAGRNLVLLPFHDKISVSSKIESAEEKNRLKQLLQSIKPQNYGVIIRTAAQGKRVAELDGELRGLVRKWESAFQRMKGVSPPKLMIRELDRVSVILRDLLGVSFNAIWVNDPQLHQEMQEYIRTIAPEKEKIVKLYKGKLPIFEHFGINKQIKSLFGRTVSFKNGAYLIIEHTEALHVIDVNSGNRSKAGDTQEINALEVNLAAAEAVARQLRLRDMGGIIVVDFIDMTSAEHRQMVYEKMKEAMSEDRTKHNILPLSKFGLMQITRQRVRPVLDIKTEEVCPVCQGTGKIGPSIQLTETIENRLKEIREKHHFNKITLRVHPYLEAYLNKGLLNSIRKQWSKKYDCKLTVQPLTSLSFLEYQFLDPYGDEIID
jgi:ribonuclease G